MCREDEPVFEVTVVFAASRERAGVLLERVTDLLCRETGGTGEGEDHVCGGFHVASVREVIGGVLSDVE